MPTYRGRFWVFTLNNWTEHEWDHIVSICPQYVDYLVIGKEVGDTGTPHLQGFLIWKRDVRMGTIKRVLLQRAHLERARGTSTQAANYCKKDGEFWEHGSLPDPARGRRRDWEHFREFVINHDGGNITDRELFLEFPGIYARHRERIHEFVALIRQPIALQDGELRPGWQTDLWGVLENPPDPRAIHFLVDPVGNTGKSWFCAYALTQRPDDVQVLRVGKRDDLAHSIDPRKNVFLFDVPRNQMEFFQYSILEMIKDRMVYSPKYASTMKIIQRATHVVVFCNEPPLGDTLSEDRYHVMNI